MCDWRESAISIKREAHIAAMTKNKETMMNADRLNDIARQVLYTLAVVLPAIVAGYVAIGSALPDWLLFPTAVISALGGGTALGNFSHRTEG